MRVALIANLASCPHKHGLLGWVRTLSANIHETEWFLRTSDAGFLESLCSCHGEVYVDLHVLFFREPLDSLPECPDATIVVGNLRDDVLRVLREILDDDRFGFLAGV